MNLCCVPEEGVAHPLPQQALPERGARLVQRREEVETGAAGTRKPRMRHLLMVARWQNLRQGGGRGGTIQGKEGIKFCSVA